MKMKGEEKVYHTHCLTCSYCTNTIEGKFFTIDGQVVCGACARGGQVGKSCMLHMAVREQNYKIVLR